MPADLTADADGAPDVRQIGRLAVIGGGVMGEALLAAALRGGLAPADVTVAEPGPERGAALAEAHGVAVVDDAARAVEGADVVLLAVKPDVVPAVLGHLAGSLRAGALVVTVAAGVPVARYEELLPAGTPVVRVMPNTPALVGAGASGISAGTHAERRHLDTARALLAPTGLVLEVPEKLLDAVTGVSGSGPAYVFYLVDALAEAGVLLGLTRGQARELAVATFHGAAQMLRETGEHPVVLRERVSSPGGATVAGLRALDEHGVRAGMLAAAVAVAERSRELGGPQAGA